MCRLCLPLIVPKCYFNINSYEYGVYFELFELEVVFPSIHCRPFPPLDWWQLEAIIVCITVTARVTIGVTSDH
jgi:hypothetical protein